MDILTPWSLSTYIPLNGFHPLYRSLASLRSPGCRLLVPRKPNFDQFRNLQRYGVFRSDFKLPPPEWADPPGGGSLFNEFVKAHSKEDIWFQANLSGDVELHHTAPVTCGDRPFLFHCESFLPVFFPFFQQGVELNKSSVDPIRGFYRRLFESRNCLGIVSHLSETLDQLSYFFESSTIDSKLIHMPIGLDPAHIADGVEKPHETTNFVFLNSAHQHPPSFALRGGVSCLKMAVELLRQRSDLTFYFRTKRPADEALASYGIEVNELKRFEGARVIWIEHYLPDQMLTKLMAKCHFLLLPSANLHSVSIMSGLANGAVPIVTDTIGTDLYVQDMVNGAVLRGVRAAIWERDEELRMLHDRHQLYLQMEKAITGQLIDRVQALLSVPGKIREMAQAGRDAVRQRFDGAAFASRLMEELLTRSARRLNEMDRPAAPRSCEGERWIEDMSHEHFEGPPQPFERARLHNGSVHQLGKSFIFVPRVRRREFLENRDWSPLRIAYEECSLELGRRARAASAASLGQCIHLARGAPAAGIVPAVSALVRRPNFMESLWLLLHPYPGPFSVARKTYHTLRRFGIVR